MRGLGMSTPDQQSWPGNLVQHADSEKIIEDWNIEADQALAAQLAAGSPAGNRAEEGVWIR